MVEALTGSTNSVLVDLTCCPTKPSGLSSEGSWKMELHLHRLVESVVPGPAVGKVANTLRYLQPQQAKRKVGEEAPKRIGTRAAKVQAPKKSGRSGTRKIPSSWTGKTLQNERPRQLLPPVLLPLLLVVRVVVAVGGSVCRTE